MGRRPCCAKQGLNRGAWSAYEDDILVNYIHTHGEGKWRDLPQKAGLKRCGKSCRLRWLNYLRPDIKRGNISAEEEDLIVRLHKLLGNRWSLIAGRLPGRTDNEIKNYWNTNLSKKLLQAKKVEDSAKHRGNLKRIASRKNSSKSNGPQELNPEKLTESQQHHVIRTKAFRCKKVVIPRLLPDDDDQMVDKNISLGSACGTPSSSGVNNSNSSDLLNDFDINDLLLTDLELKSEMREAKESKNNYEDVNCNKDFVNGFFDFPVDETMFDSDHCLMDETLIRSENWSDTFGALEIGTLDNNAFSPFLNSLD